MHGPIRQTYHKLTNFKDVTPQLIKHDHRRAVALFIREQLDALDGPEDSLCPADLEAEVQSNISIGSKLKPIMFQRWKMECQLTLPSKDFACGLESSSQTFYQHLDTGYPMETGLDLKNRQGMHSNFCMSLGNWTSTMDYLRCNPNFHGQSRYDGALVKTTNGLIFVQLIYMFSCMALRLHRVRAKPRKDAEIISAHSIVRGALLAPDFDSADEFFVVDIADTDISLRLKSLYPDHYLH
ncbi:hypothetical protein B0H10DRAFT_1821857 [Mycena sp. CBHHK59/15]|nr:hypothetical protein B0H10DRAFT_1821857 [Mycena sp. CBHHK59/15]